MDFDSVLTYSAYSQILDSTLAIYGQPCTLFVPKQMKTVGYEDQDIRLEQFTSVSDIENHYSMFQSRVFIEFKISKKVAYHFNYFPEDGEEMVTAMLPTNSVIREGSYIRTAVPGQVSVWGDLIYSVEDIRDDGRYQTLVRYYFLRNVSGSDVARLLDIQKYKGQGPYG
jgi:hypothetical protein